MNQKVGDTGIHYIAEISARIDHLIHSQGNSDDICSAISEQLAALIFSPAYAYVLGDLLENPVSGPHIAALINRIKSDVPALKALEFLQLGVFVPKCTEDFLDLSMLYLGFAGRLIELGAPTIPVPEKTKLH